MNTGQIITLILGAFAVLLFVLWFIVGPIVGWFFREAQRAAGVRPDPVLVGACNQPSHGTIHHDACECPCHWVTISEEP